MSAANPTLTEAMDKTLQEVTSGTGGSSGTNETTPSDKGDEKGTGTETKADEKVPETSRREDRSETRGELEVDASPEEIKAALTFFRGLASEEGRSATLEYLAKQAGYDLTRKAEAKQFVRDTRSVLKEKLGNTYDIIEGDKLAEAFDELLSHKVEAQLKPALERVALSERAANEQRANAAMENFFTRHKIPHAERENVAASLMKKAQRFQAGENVSVDEYLDDVYSLVNHDTARARELKDRSERIARNANEVQTSGKGGSSETVKVSKLPTLKEAVEAAAAGRKLETD